jgi:hypothetical protein
MTRPGLLHQGVVRGRLPVMLLRQTVARSYPADLPQQVSAVIILQQPRGPRMSRITSRKRR